MEDWKKDLNRRAIAIYRVSSEDQKKNGSHDTQRFETTRYCKDNELNLVREFEIAESAKNSDERKKYKAAMNWAASHGVRHIAFYYYNRETRNLSDNEQNEKLVREDKIVLHYVHERKVIFKGSSNSDFFMRDIHAVTSKQYSRDLGARVKAALRYKAENGWFPSNTPPLGYVPVREKDEGGKETKRSIVGIDPNAKRVRQVQREFELRAQGFSYDEIRAQIIEEGFIPFEKVRSYFKSQIEGRIKNPFYRGYFRWEGIQYRGKHELIISESDLIAVDETLQVKRGRRNQQVVTPIFTGGWLRCGTPGCGCQITYDPKTKIVKTTGEKRVYHYYRCSNSKKVHASLRGMNVAEDTIWNQLHAAVDHIALAKEFAKEIADALNKVHVKANAATKAECEKFKVALVQLEHSEDDVYDHFRKGSIDETMYRRQLERIRKERGHYSDQLQRMSIAINDAFMQTAKTIFELATNAKSLWNFGTPTERMSILKRICSNPVLDGATVKYDLKKPYATLTEMKENQEWPGRQDSNLRPLD